MSGEAAILNLIGSQPEPHDLEAEMAVLGAVLLGNGTVLANLTGLRPCHFYREAHGLMWAAMLALHRDRAGVDFLVLVDYMRREGTLERVGGRAAIDALAGTVPNIGNVQEYAAIVRRLAQWRRRARAVHSLRAAVDARDDQAYRAALEKAS